MGDSQSRQRRPLRSARWFRKDDLPGFVHRSTLSTVGWSREDLMTRPIIGILNTWSDINPCNLNLRALAEEVRIGIVEAGGVPFEVPLLSLSENIIKPSSFPFRNLLSMDAEECEHDAARYGCGYSPREHSPASTRRAAQGRHRSVPRLLSRRKRPHSGL